MSFMMLVMIFMIMPRASVSAKRIMEVLSTAPTIVDGNLKEGKSGSAGEVEFRNVSFRYPDADGDVLHAYCENTIISEKRSIFPIMSASLISTAPIQ